MDWTWLFVLICPVMMLFMMKGMHGGGSHKHNNHVEHELNELKKLNVEMKKDLNELKNSVNK
ncbi:DUF2933 domain-containing protein [Paenibacillus agricola]|uniref:DUF2933 domain-containing protein n=1 Tax=Paenibacillus agricola TaxID=2716264 RepID=A0ABX0JA32_9BACL|nr:DUF2933 domain-containing protein [Paenibacillus agricola]NHN33305.1 DUF2933 domain-containing protein [Paenibacillus agricola]